MGRRSASMKAVLLGFAALSGLAQATHLSESRLGKVYDVMKAINVLSWENGTMGEAILEWSYPSLSVFSDEGNPFPKPGSISSGQISQIVDLATATMNNRPASNTSSNPLQGSTLLEDGAAADPASLGITVMLANASTSGYKVKGVGFGEAATEELQYLLYQVPRSQDGALSHRTEQMQYWADFVAMVPPFLAYYGGMTNNQTLLQAAYTQCQLYRSALRQPNNLWAHILGGNGAHDPGMWATGNAWAAWGMARVLATIKKSSFAGQMSSQTADLGNWIGEIMTGCQPFITSNGLLRNYINDSTSFEDCASTALMASTAFRLSTMNVTDQWVNMGSSLLSGASNHVNSTGHLNNVVNPLAFDKEADESPEGQSFIILGYAAYKQWDQRGAPGKNVSGDPLGPASAAYRTVAGGGNAAAAAIYAGIALASVLLLGGYTTL